jgi:type VI secretion system protein VasD
MALALAACGGQVKPPPEIHLKIQFIASATINPDPSGRASPVALSVLQLKTADAFMNADYFAASNPTSPALLPDVVGREEITLKPGETRDLPIKVDMAATRIGVIGAFRDIEHATWRAQIAVPTPPEKASGPVDMQLTVRVDGLKVSIEPGKP